ncbi:MAG: hypothetical protein WBM69_27755 [Desulfobacterales bacterium]
MTPPQADGVIHLESVIDRIKEGWQRSKRSGDDFYLDSVALNLHGFYSGLERIFELIASSVDSSKPDDKEWHKTLLYQMAQEVPQVRSAVISEKSRSRLDKLAADKRRQPQTFRPADLAGLKLLSLRD